MPSSPATCLSDSPEATPRSTSSSLVERSLEIVSGRTTTEVATPSRPWLTPGSAAALGPCDKAWAFGKPTGTLDPSLNETIIRTLNADHARENPSVIRFTYESRDNLVSRLLASPLSHSRVSPSLDRCDEGKKELAPGLGCIDDRAVSRAFEHLELHVTAVVAVLLEDVANLRHHGLGRKHFFSRPARDESHFPERSHLPRGPVGHDDVGRSVSPEHGRLGIDVHDVGPVAVFRRKRVQDAARARGDAGPVGRRRRVARVAVVTRHRFQNLLHQHVLALRRLVMGGRPVGRVDDVARRERRDLVAAGGGGRWIVSGDEPGTI